MPSRTAASPSHHTPGFHTIAKCRQKIRTDLEIRGFLRRVGQRIKYIGEGFSFHFPALHSLNRFVASSTSSCRVCSVFFSKTCSTRTYFGNVARCVSPGRQGQPFSWASSRWARCFLHLPQFVARTDPGILRKASQSLPCISKELDFLHTKSVNWRRIILLQHEPTRDARAAGPAPVGAGRGISRRL